MDWNREAAAAAIVGTGGAWMVGLAVRNHPTHALNAVQRRGLLLSGSGFLMTAAATRWMQGWGRVGIAVSLAGTVLVMAGMYQLVRERAARRTPGNSDARK